MCEYLFELCNKFNDLYSSAWQVDGYAEESKFLLFEATKVVMGKCLDLLGITLDGNKHPFIHLELDDLTVNGLKLSGTPNHKLALKVGALFMLLRYIDHTAGLCNGTRLRILKLGEHVIEAQITTGTYVGHTTIIPRLKLSPSDKRLPLKINRCQFPLAICFAITINKSQGQSLSKLGIFCLSQSTHMVYVVGSRVRSRKGLKVLIYEKDPLFSRVKTRD
nr:hypothetical protein [Tanacetum cinerariifolium]